MRDILIYQKNYTVDAECTPEEKETRLLDSVKEVAAMQKHAYFSCFDEARWLNARSFIMSCVLVAVNKSAKISIFLDDKKDTVSAAIFAKDMNFDAENTHLLSGLCDSAFSVSFLPPSTADQQMALLAHYNCF